MASTLENLADRFSHSVFVNAGLSLRDASTALLVARRLIEEAEGAQTEPLERWIPCSERLPELDILVLAFYRLGLSSGVDIAKRKASGYWLRDSFTLRSEEVTHWMPLPAGPKEPGT